MEVQVVLHYLDWLETSAHLSSIGNNDNLINNPFSLIKKANLLFIETPAGVGYSTINDVNFKFDDTING